MATTVARNYLAFVGLAYLALGLWCAAAPERTSRVVGFDLHPGQGQSEFLTVYGGLEVALGLIFLWPLFQRRYVGEALVICTLVHACLVVFRTIAFFIYTDFAATTYTLAALEWTIFLSAAALLGWTWIRYIRQPGGPSSPNGQKER